MEEKNKEYKIVLGSTNSLICGAKVTIKNITEFKKFLVYINNKCYLDNTISINNNNVKNICNLVIDLYENNSEYKSCIKLLKTEIEDQYQNEDNCDKELGFMINRKLNEIANEYGINNSNINIFLDSEWKIIKKINNVVKAKTKFKSNKAVFYIETENKKQNTKKLTEITKEMENQINHEENKENNCITCNIF